MNKKNIEGMEWGNDVFQYIKLNHMIGKETGKTTFLGINGPQGIGKKRLIQTICSILGREFLCIDYVDWIHNSNSFSEMYQENVLILINDTPIESGGYCDEINNFVEQYKYKKNNFFVFSSHTLLGMNTAISTKFRVFLYGRLSFDEKIAYARTVVKKCKIDLHLENVKIPDEVLAYIVKYYTKEAGVRSLSVWIHNLFEYINWNNDFDKNNKIIIRKEQISSILGNEKYVTNEMITQRCLQGVGMAWTKWGGILLPIEILLIKGKGKIFLLGNIGNIMKESVDVVISYFKFNYKKWGIKKNFLSKYNIHINIYEQSIYKDGSSAGLAFFVHILCTIKKIKFKEAIAFSGEISLEGLVLRVGGLKEKLCVAQEHGIKKIVLPKQSWLEYQSISNELKENLFVYFIDDVMELKQMIQKEKR